LKSYGVIYSAFNTETGKSYVGQAVQTTKVDAFTRRKREHLRMVNGLKTPFYSSLKNHGKEAFVWFELFRSSFDVDDELNSVKAQTELNAAEEYWIAELNSVYPNGYNLRLGGESGGRHSKATKLKIAEKSRGNSSHLGHKHSAETRAFISEQVKLAFHRNPHVISVETARKISASKKGKKFSKEHCLAMSLSRKGKKQSPETIAKRAASNRHPRGPYKKQQT